MWRKTFVVSLTAAILILLLAVSTSTVNIFSGLLESAYQNHVYWYVSRTSAMLAYILLFVNIVFGLGLKTKFLEKISAQWQRLDLHKFTALLAMALIGLHIFSLLGDIYTHPSLKSLLVPLSGGYRPAWTALGIISFYVLFVIVLSSYLRNFISQRVWRAIHMLSFVLFYVILYHSVRDGTDSSSVWVQITYFMTGTAAAFLFLWRFLLSGRVQKEELVVRPGLKLTQRQRTRNAIK